MRKFEGIREMTEFHRTLKHLVPVCFSNRNLFSEPSPITFKVETIYNSHTMANAGVK